MKPTKTFRLAKQTKRLMASMVSAEMRNHFKRLMIEGQLQSQVVPKREKTDSK